MVTSNSTLTVMSTCISVATWIRYWNPLSVGWFDFTTARIMRIDIRFLIEVNHQKLKNQRQGIHIHITYPTHFSPSTINQIWWGMSPLCCIINIPSICTNHFVSKFILRIAKEWHFVHCSGFSECYNMDILKAILNRNVPGKQLPEVHMFMKLKHEIVDKQKYITLKI